MPLLRSNLIHLKPLEIESATNVLEAVVESRETVGKWMTWASPAYSIENARSWIQTCNEERSRGLSYEFGVFTNDDGCFVGVAGFNQFNTLNKFCNLGYWIRQSAQRRGYAVAAIELLRPYAFNELKLQRIEIVVLEQNHPSAATAERAGACFEGIARNRLQHNGKPANARLYSLVPAEA